MKPRSSRKCGGLHPPLCALAGVILLLAATACQPIRAPATPPGQTNEESRPATTEEVQFPSGDAILAGTLTLPDGPGPHPVVITITGSGPQNRDNGVAELPAYRPFAQIAEELAQAGIATLRYDDRGVGGSSGDISEATPLDLLADAVAARDYLLGRTAIDPARVGALGHSEGGQIAAMLAADHPEIAFVVSLAGPMVDGLEMLIDTLHRYSRNVPAEQREQAEEAAAAEIQATALALAGDWSGLEDYLTTRYVAQLETLPAETREAMGELEPLARQQAQQVVKTYRSQRFQVNMRYDPAQDWVRIATPALVLFAEADVSVSAALHRPALEQALARSGYTGVTVETRPGLTHFFQPVSTPGALETMPRDEPMDQATVERIVQWIAQQVR